MFCAWFFSLWWMEKNSLAVSTSKKVPLKVARPCAFHFFMFTAGLWLWHSKIDSQGAKKESEREKERESMGDRLGRCREGTLHQLRRR